MDEPTIESARTASTVKGWGADADPNNDPTYPMKHRTDDGHAGYDWERPPQQPVDIEVLHSNERPNVSATFGTAAPPSGVSGMLRRFAFRYSESSYAHWLPLMLADRVNMIEGVFDDIRHGHLPNLFHEWGWRADWQHQRGALVARVALKTVVAGAVLVFLRGRRRR